MPLKFHVLVNEPHNFSYEHYVCWTLVLQYFMVTQQWWYHYMTVYIIYYLKFKIWPVLFPFHDVVYSLCLQKLVSFCHFHPSTKIIPLLFLETYSPYITLVTMWVPLPTHNITSTCNLLYQFRIKIRVVPKLSILRGSMEYFRLHNTA